VTFALEVSPATSGWTFNSKNSNIASVSDSGVVTTHYVGTTTLYARQEAGGFVDSVQVTVKPRKTFYEEPCLSFFALEQTVREFEAATVYSIGSSEMFYTLYTRECGIGCTFDLKYYFNSDNEYAHSSLCFNSLFTDDVIDHVNERYIFISEKRNGDLVYRYYKNPGNSLLIEQYSTENKLWLSYHPYTVQAIDAIQNDTTRRVFDF